MPEMKIAQKNVLLDLISDFEDFINKLEKRKEELEVLKDDLLIYSDPAFMASIKKGMEDAESGNTVRCEDRIEMEKLFESL